MGSPCARATTGGRFAMMRSDRNASPLRRKSMSSNSRRIRSNSDRADLYAAPDGYLDQRRKLSSRAAGRERQARLRNRLNPDDGLYPLPYMARQATGAAGKKNASRPTLPPPARDRVSIPTDPAPSRRSTASPQDGLVGKVSGKAEVKFFRVASAGRLHERPLRADANRRGRRRYPARDARARFLSLQAATSLRTPAPSCSREADQ